MKNCEECREMIQKKHGIGAKPPCESPYNEDGECWPSKSGVDLSMLKASSADQPALQED